jgi:hypothetical protein
MKRIAKKRKHEVSVESDDVCKTQRLDAATDDARAPLSGAEAVANETVAAAPPAFLRILVYNSPLAWKWAEFLSAGSVFALRRVCRDMRDMTGLWRHRKILTRRVLAALREVQLDDPRFHAALVASHAMVSGSFVLRAIEGAAWSAGDVDIYRPTAYDTNTRPYAPIEGYLWHRVKQRSRRYTEGDYPGLPFDGVRTYQVPMLTDDAAAAAEEEAEVTVAATTASTHGPATPKVDEDEDDEWLGPFVSCQVIRHAGAPSKWIPKHFDSKFLCNTFDGKRVVVHHVDAVRTSTSAYLPSMGTEERHDTHYARIFKYIDRGFHFSNLVISHHVVDEIPLVRYQVAHLDQTFLHRDHVRSALCFSKDAARAAGVHLPMFRPELIPEAQIIRHCVPRGMIALPKLGLILKHQTGSGLYDTERTFYREQLNARFRQFHRWSQSEFNDDDD